MRIRGRRRAGVARRRPARIRCCNRGRRFFGSTARHGRRERGGRGRGHQQPTSCRGTQVQCGVRYTGPAPRVLVRIIDHQITIAHCDDLAMLASWSLRKWTVIPRCKRCRASRIRWRSLRNLRVATSMRYRSRLLAYGGSATNLAKFGSNEVKPSSNRANARAWSPMLI